MKDLHDHYCRKCGYDFESPEEEESNGVNSEVPEYLRNFVLRLTGIVL